MLLVIIYGGFCVSPNEEAAVSCSCLKNVMRMVMLINLQMALLPRCAAPRSEGTRHRRWCGGLVMPGSRLGPPLKMSRRARWEVLTSMMVRWWWWFEAGTTTEDVQEGSVRWFLIMAGSLVPIFKPNCILWLGEQRSASSPFKGPPWSRAPVPGNGVDFEQRFS